VIALVLTVVGLSVFAGGADAASTRVSIGNFEWSKDPQIDLGERVIWDWIGPDSAHSVTGRGPGGVLVDSDPLTAYPNHAIGDTFEYTFDEPGQFTFVCKVHASVRGTVTVSDTPGDPNSDPGPAPQVFWDGEAPQLEEVRPLQSRLGHRGNGGELRFAISEKALADVEYYRVVKTGPKKNRRWVRKFVGYSEWETFVGYNIVQYGVRSETFPASPGRYVGLLRATDQSGNIAGPVTFRFEIAAPPKKR
jgi:plastocyanin